MDNGLAGLTWEEPVLGGNGGNSGPYDYDSIMHHPARALAAPRVSPDEDGSQYRSFTILLATSGSRPGKEIDPIRWSLERPGEEVDISLRIAFDLPVDRGEGMKIYTSTIQVATHRQREFVDITESAREKVHESGIESGLCALYAHGATAALMIQENDDPQVPEDILDCLDRLIPAGGWRHDRIDDNAAAHIQAGIVGPSETIPIRDGALALSRWQNVFLCDFDGPRRSRRVLVTITGV